MHPKHIRWKHQNRWATNGPKLPTIEAVDDWQSQLVRGDTQDPLHQLVIIDFDVPQLAVSSFFDPMSNHELHLLRWRLASNLGEMVGKKMWCVDDQFRSVARIEKKFRRTSTKLLIIVLCSENSFAIILHEWIYCRFKRSLTLDLPQERIQSWMPRSSLEALHQYLEIAYTHYVPSPLLSRLNFGSISFK